MVSVSGVRARLSGALCVEAWRSLCWASALSLSKPGAFRRSLCVGAWTHFVPGFGGIFWGGGLCVEDRGPVLSVSGPGALSGWASRPGRPLPTLSLSGPGHLCVGVCLVPALCSSGLRTQSGLALIRAPPIRPRRPPALIRSAPIIGIAGPQLRSACHPSATGPQLRSAIRPRGPPTPHPAPAPET